jgi:TRAP transporter TAXI family solute receptor
MTDSKKKPAEKERPSRQPGLFDEIRERRRDLLKVFGPGAIATLLGFSLALYFVEPPPPSEVVIAAGKRDGGYFATAKLYAEAFAENGVKLTVRETAGSVENYDLLLNDNTVRVAIAQGGAAPATRDTSGLETIASLYLEPVWVFHREIGGLTQLSDLAGKRIAVGAAGSGTQLLTELLLKVNGVKPNAETSFVPCGGQEAVNQLKANQVEAVFLVESATSPLVRQLLLDDRFELLSMKRSLAYSRRFQFLESVTLEPGVIDFDANLPSQSVQLIAPHANLIATSELHDALIPLFLSAATLHQPRGLLVGRGRHPSLNGAEFPANAVARDYLKHGPSFFQRHLSFWIASLIDRAKIMLVPLLILLIPLAKVAPPVYRWRIRSRIYRWYAILRQLDQFIRNGDPVVLDDCKKKLNTMENELIDVKVPLSYMEEFYNLRLHLDLVQRRLADRTTSPPDDPKD